MVDEPQKLFISLASVDAGLNMLRTYEDSASSEAITLASLTIISDFINEEAAPSVDKALMIDYAIKLLLSDTIIQLLTELRRHYDLEAPDINDNRQTLQQQIEQDSATASRELMGLSYLYTYYVRSELNLSQQDFELYSHTTTRTIARYRKLALVILTEHIINLEWEARERHRKARLLAKLPLSNDNFVGREHELVLAIDSVQNSEQPIIVMGEAGIGKTAFLNFLAHALIETNYDNLIWIDNPISATQVINLVQAEINLQNATPLELAKTLMLQPTLIIIDNADILADHQQLSRIINVLHNATLLIAKGLEPESDNDSVRIHLSCLSRTESDLIVHTIQNQEQVPNLPKITEAAWLYANGHPSLIKQYLKQQQTLTSSPAISPDDGYDDIFKTLGISTKVAWLVLALCQKKYITANMLDILTEFNFISEYDWNTLVKHFLLEFVPDTDRVFFSHGAIRYIQNQVIHIDSLTPEVERLLTELPYDQRSLLIVECLLQADWMETYQLFAPEHLLSFARLGYDQQHYLSWFKILYRNRNSLSPELQLLFAQILRKTGDTRQAEEILLQLIEYFGSVGDFQMQFEAQLTLAQTKLLTGEYAQCFALLQHLREQATAVHWKQPLNTLEIQIGIDTLNVNLANSLIQQHAQGERYIPSGMLAELHLISREVDVSLTIAQNALADIKTNTTIATLYTVIGRCYLVKQKPYRALDFFNAALLLLKPLGNWLLLARTQMNIALCLANTDDLDGAVTQLKKAIKLQADIQDALGLRISKQNLSYIQRLQLSQSQSSQTSKNT